MGSWRTTFASGLREDAQEVIDRLRARQDHQTAEMVKAREMERRNREDRTPIPADKWIENEYFCGSLARTMYPKLKEHFIRIVGGNYHIVILRGATRWGKTYAARALTGRSLYELNCYAHPQRTFHVQDEQEFLYVAMNTTDSKSRDAFFRTFSEWARSTPYFRNEFEPTPRIITRLQFPKHVLFKYAGAQPSAVESEDLFFYVGDESNKYDVVEDSKRARARGDGAYDAAEIVRSEIDLRMGGTFRRPDGTYPSACKQVWLCSETYPKAFIPRLHAEMERKGMVRPGGVYVIESSTWGMRPRRCTRCEEIVDEEAFECGKCGERVKSTTYFWFKTGSRVESPRIIDDRDEAERETTKAKSSEGEYKFRVVPVPMEFRTEVSEANMEQFQRDRIGIPTEAISKLYRRVEPIAKAVRGPGDVVCGVEVTADLAAHPFTALTTDTTDGVHLVTERICGRSRYGDGEGEWEWTPLVNPGVPRYYGVDAGKTGDPFGLVVGHRCGWKRVVRVRQEGDGEAGETEELKPEIWIDLVLRIVPPPGGEISYAWVRGTIFMLIKRGFNMAGLRCDSFQHVAVTQAFSERGYDADVCSMDTDPSGHFAARDAVYDGRLHLYKYPPLEEELRQLERITTQQHRGGHLVERVDHPPGESKDCADALAQVVWQIEQASEGVVPVDERPKPSLGGVEEDRPETRAAQRGKERGDAWERGDIERMMDMEREDDAKFPWED